MKKLILIIIMASVMSASAGDDETPGQSVTAAEIKARAAKLTSDRFELWNHCLPVTVDLRTNYIGAFVSDLEIEEVEATIRSRLQNEQLYNPEPSVSSILHLGLNVEPETFTIKTAYIKPVTDLASGVSALVKTWEQYWLPEEQEKLNGDLSLISVKRHNKDKGYVLYWVSKYVDKFIEEYLRVNADACAHR